MDYIIFLLDSWNTGLPIVLSKNFNSMVIIKLNPIEEGFGMQWVKALGPEPCSEKCLAVSWFSGFGDSANSSSPQPEKMQIWLVCPYLTVCWSSVLEDVEFTSQALGPAILTSFVRLNLKHFGLS